MIFSRNNILIVHNTPRFDAVVTPQHLINKKQTLKKVAKTLDMTLSKVKEIIKKNRRQASYRPIVIKKNISRKEVAIIETESIKMPGVSVLMFISREYKDREVGGHLLGFIGEMNKNQISKYRKRDNYNYKSRGFHWTIRD